MADSKEKLFSDFSPVSTEQWMEKVTADLKGADFEKKLVWKTNEGFKVKPFYRMEDLEGLKTTDALPGEFPYLRGTKKDNNEWLVRQEIKVECPKEANAKALDILNKGVDSLSFHVKAKELNAEYLETLLNDIQAECVELNFSTCQGHVVELANLLVAYFRKKDYKIQGWKSYCFLLLADYCANFFELFLRLQGDALTMKLQSKILLIALIRTVLLWVILTGLGSYKLELLTQEHASRYQRLLLLISKLNGEVIWMKKNTELIEKTMELSYKLFSEMQKQNVDRELSQTALAVAKDIHEIKKEYMLILRGISEAMDLNLQDGSMSLSDILTVMETTLQQAAAEQGKKLTFAKEYKTNIMTDKHYFLLSIFRNLFTNALEANETGEVTLRFTQWEEGQEDCFSICDDGPGIPKENIPNIFTPGFSTKINFSTGEINRGLGLNLVKDMIENQFHGKITVESVPGQTTFLIRIPKIQLEVD